MGYSTIAIKGQTDIQKLKMLARHMEVTEASQLEYFNNYNWLKNVTNVELRKDDNSIYFALADGDFVRVER